MIPLIATALAAPPQSSVFPGAEHGAPVEVRVGAAVNPRPEPAPYTHGVDGTFGVVLRPGRLRIAARVAHPLEGYTHLDSTASVQVSLIDSGSFTLAPWVLGSARIPDQPCRVRCPSWEKMAHHDSELAAYGGLTLGWRARGFGWTLVIPVVPTAAHEVSGAIGLPLVATLVRQEVSMDWHLHEHFRHPLHVSNTVRLFAGGAPPPRRILEDLDDLGERVGRAGVAWRLQGRRVFVETRGELDRDGVSGALTAGFQL